jgi:hypothetical protein
VVNVKMRGLKVYEAVNGHWYVYVRKTGEALLKNFKGSKDDVRKRSRRPR